MSDMGCPWCGSPPAWLSKSNAFGTGASGSEPPSRALGCNNSKCPVQPHTEWRDTEEYVSNLEARNTGKTQGYHKIDLDDDARADWNNRK